MRLGNMLPATDANKIEQTRIPRAKPFHETPDKPQGAAISEGQANRFSYPMNCRAIKLVSNRKQIRLRKPVVRITMGNLARGM